MPWHEMSAGAADWLLAASSAAPTPSLIVDLAAVDRNIESARRRVGSLRLRPHYKAHKSTELMARQVPGRSGVTCATAQEAAALAAAGFDDILVANAVVSSHSLAELGSVARARRITVAVDCLAHVRLLAAMAAVAAVRLAVLIEVDVGHRRCGIPPDDVALLDVAAAVVDTSGLEMAGIMGYEGHAALEPDEPRRAGLVARASDQLAMARARLTAAGFGCDVVSGGSTGTLDLAVANSILTEIQAGSYVLMDTQYAALGLGFEQALYCVTTVVSAHDGRVVCDAGLKSLNGDGPLPAACRSDLAVDRLNDEHLILTTDGLTPPAVGDRLLIVPSHVDPCVNLHDVLYVVDPRGGLEVWAVDGRRHGGSLSHVHA